MMLMTYYYRRRLGLEIIGPVAQFLTNGNILAWRLAHNVIDNLFVIEQIMNPDISPCSQYLPVHQAALHKHVKFPGLFTHVPWLRHRCTRQRFPYKKNNNAYVT